MELPMTSAVSSRSTPGERPRLVLADALTLSRLPLAAALWIAPEERWALLGLVVTAGITDVLDGWAARRAARKAGLPGPAGGAGDWLDPLCDKTFVLSAMGVVWVTTPMPAWALLALLTREVLLAVLFLAWRIVPVLRRRVRLAVRAEVLGKTTTVLQFAALVALVLAWAAAPFLIAGAAAAGLATGGLYLVRGLRALTGPGRSGPPGPTARR